MTIDDKAFQELSELAQLTFSETDKQACMEKISALVAGIEKVAPELIMDLVPLAHPEDIEQRLRDDIVVEDAVTSPSQLSEHAQNGFFCVPQVIE